MAVSTSSAAVPRVAIRAGARVQAMLAICLGLVVIGFAGFSHIDAVHNASHDTRHANGFPCH